MVSEQMEIKSPFMVPTVTCPRTVQTDSQDSGIVNPSVCLLLMKRAESTRARQHKRSRLTSHDEPEKATATARERTESASILASYYNDWSGSRHDTRLLGIP